MLLVTPQHCLYLQCGALDLTGVIDGEGHSISMQKVFRKRN